MLDDEWRALGRHTFGGVISITNLQLWREGGYFDGPAAFKPLQHLWSLGVEEQFYLLWPTVLWLGSRSRLVLVVAVFTAASFIVNLELSFGFPSAAFYLPFGRLCEPAVGGLLTFVVVPLRFRVPLAIAGLVALLQAFTSISEFDFPSLPVLVPVFAAAALISSGPQVLGWKPLSRLGLISYPLYLWHWPVLVFARFVSSAGLEAVNPRLPIGTALGVLLISVVLAVATWHLVETPIRERRVISVRGLLLAGAAVFVAGVSISSGFLRLPATDPRVALYEAALHDPLMPGEGLTRKPALGPYSHFAVDALEPQVAFIGDSAMEQYATTVIDRSRAVPSRPFAFFTAPGCSLVFPLDVETCRGAIIAARTLAEQPGLETVVLANQWFTYFDNPRFISAGAPIALDSDAARARLDDFEGWLKTVTATRRVLVLLTAPVGDDLSPRRMMHRAWWHTVRFDDQPLSRSMLEARSDQANAAIAARALRAGAEVVDALRGALQPRDVPTGAFQRRADLPRWPARAPEGALGTLHRARFDDRALIVVIPARAPPIPNRLHRAGGPPRGAT